MTENERLAEQIIDELKYAIVQYEKRIWTAEEWLQRLRYILKASGL